MSKEQAIAQRVSELQRIYEAWSYRKLLKDGYWLESILKAWGTSTALHP